MVMSNCRYKNTEQELIEAVKQSSSWKESCVKLNRNSSPSSQSHLKNICNKFNIDSSHFKGFSWRKGLSFRYVKIEVYFRNERRITSHNLRNRLIKEGFKKDECEICHNDEWLGLKIPLELDHKDSNHNNNELLNLQILCPNCHAIETKKRILLKKKKNTRISQRKVKVRPSLESLVSDVESLGYRKTGRKYGVSDNSIRKWIKWEQQKNTDSMIYNRK